MNGVPADQAVITCAGTPEDPEGGAKHAEVHVFMDQRLAESAPAGRSEPSSAGGFEVPVGDRLQKQE